MSNLRSLAHDGGTVGVVRVFERGLFEPRLNQRVLNKLREGGVFESLVVPDEGVVNVLQPVSPVDRDLGGAHFTRGH